MCVYVVASVCKFGEEGEPPPLRWWLLWLENGGREIDQRERQKKKREWRGEKKTERGGQIDVVVLCTGVYVCRWCMYNCVFVMGVRRGRDEGETGRVRERV